MMQKTKRSMINKLHYQPWRRVMSRFIPQHALPQRLGRIPMLFREIRFELQELGFDGGEIGAGVPGLS
jgi:hypothetical protein